MVLMRFLKRLSGCREYEYKQQTKHLEQQLEALKNNKLVADEIDSLNQQLQHKEQQLTNLQVAFDLYKSVYVKPQHEDPEYVIPISIINTTQLPYLPYCKFYYWAGTKIDAMRIQFTPGKFYRIWSDEMYMFFRNAIKDCETFDQKVVALRDAIKDKVTYKFDVNRSASGLGENWRLPTDTYYGQVGDCEDTTILWVTACHVCNLPADRVFNGTGYVQIAGRQYGHSFGLAKFNDGVWKVIETTSKVVPITFTGSDYRTGGVLNGLTNWNMSGRAKMEQF